MQLRINKLFDALGDSILLATYCKAYNITEIITNRAIEKKDTLKEIFSLYNVELPKFKQTIEPIKYNLAIISIDLLKNNIPLISPNIATSESDYITVQKTTTSLHGKDRHCTLDELMIMNSCKNYKEIKDTNIANTITDLVCLLKRSQEHLSIDSGTAWMAASMGIPTKIYSKNSYYFVGAWHYMNYLNSMGNVDVWQWHNKGIKVPTELEFNIANPTNMTYDKYIHDLKHNPWT